MPDLSFMSGMVAGISLEISHPLSIPSLAGKSVSQSKVSSGQLIDKSNKFPIKISTGFSAEIDKMILKFIKPSLTSTKLKVSHYLILRQHRTILSRQHGTPATNTTLLVNYAPI